MRVLIGTMYLCVLVWLNIYMFAVGMTGTEKVVLDFLMGCMGFSLYAACEVFKI
jgi:hypothetical protein